MSSLWTPGGERPVPPTPPAAAASAGADPAAAASAAGEPEQPELTEEQQEQARAMAADLSQARARLLETDVSTVLVNHALGIYELAAIHLTAEEPKFDEAKLAIDGLAALVEGLAGRLGEGEPTLREALHQAQMAFVQRNTGDKPA